MSTGTFLVGSIELKKGVTEKQARKLIWDIGECTEVNEALKGTVDFTYFIENMIHQHNGKAIVINEGDHFTIRYSDISHSRHIYSEKMDSLREKLKENKGIIKEVSFSLYYLGEVGGQIYFRSSAKRGSFGSWDS